VLPGTTVVLGLLTTKRAELEGAKALQERIRAATEFVPLERPALSPQCGFNSASQGNRLTHDDQTAKLRRVVEVAHTVWGRVAM
jgi:5-methyltetrahydropteroyltriglutamate--homocysteine methyltransferase